MFIANTPEPTFNEITPEVQQKIDLIDAVLQACDREALLQSADRLRPILDAQISHPMSPKSARCNSIVLY